MKQIAEIIEGRPLIHAEKSLRAITGSPRGAGQTPAEQQLSLVGSQFDFAYIDDIIEEGLDNSRAKTGQIC